MDSNQTSEAIHAGAKLTYNTKGHHARRGYWSWQSWHRGSSGDNLLCIIHEKAAPMV